METPSIEELRESLELVDSMSQDAFGRIQALCSLTLLAMQQHGHPVDMEYVAQVLIQIDQAAEEAESCINSAAERVACSHKDLNLIRRSNARHAWRESKKQVVA